VIQGETSSAHPHARTSCVSGHSCHMPPHYPLPDSWAHLCWFLFFCCVSFSTLYPHLSVLISQITLDTTNSHRRRTYPTENKNKHTWTPRVRKAMQVRRRWFGVFHFPLHTMWGKNRNSSKNLKKSKNPSNNCWKIFVYIHTHTAADASNWRFDLSSQVGRSPHPFTSKSYIDERKTDFCVSFQLDSTLDASPPRLSYSGYDHTL